MRKIINKYKELITKLLTQKRLFTNMSWLFVLNFSNNIVPYFTFPYITRIFLPEGYGTLSFALAFIGFFITFIDYGFNLTGARKVAEVEENKNELSKVYSSILITKLLLFLVTLPLIFGFVAMNAQLNDARIIIYILIIMAFSSVIMPSWLFQGLQKMKYMTLISLSIRTIFMISVFTFVKSPNDIYLYTFLYSISFVIIAFISLIVIHSKVKIRLSRVSGTDIKLMLIDGFYVFSSSAVIKVMASSGILVLGLVSTSTITGLYAGISKINQVIVMFYYPIGQALFPFLSKIYLKSFEEGYYTTQKITRIIAPIFIVITLIIIIFRKLIVEVVLGEAFVNAADLLIILAFLPLLSIISNFLGTLVLVASNHTKEYSRAFLKGSLISLVLYFGMGYLWELWGVAYAAFLGAIVNIVFLYIEIRKIRKK